MKYRDDKTGTEYESLDEFRRASGRVFPEPVTSAVLRLLGLTPVEEASAEESLQRVKEAKREEIKRSLEEFRRTATVASKVGFTIDATERSLVDIQGLLALHGGEDKLLFRAADNTFHQVTVEQLQVMEKEVYSQGLAGYKIKWALDAAVDAATTEAEVRAIEVRYA